ncbi:ribonuclease Z, mitochondrial isoform X2 [Aethina tumida]|uniref:ribonuclease Z, mitochondrial isoform X2 n=1 Tax=Aethina tumida TaxID=116153 RepID=UPI0021477722|nr:ribonuclease Z, mitochondrial isoform X2 [Aethina tumida]
MPVFPNLLYSRLSLVHFIRSYATVDRTNLYKLLAKMPKEPKHIAEAQKQRNKIKEKYAKYVPGKVTLQVLGTGAKGAPRALYMFSDQSRYLFNCGEGTQRLAHEHKMKLAKLEHIFITQPVWKNIGGLPGTALTIQDVGVPEITLHGPRGLEEIFFATKRFVVIRDLKIKMADCSEHTVFEDNVMKVTYVPLIRSEEVLPDIQEEDEENSFGVQVGTSETCDANTSTRCEKKRRRSRSKNREETEVDDTDYYAHEQSGLRTMGGGGMTEEVEAILAETKEKGVSMCYVCRLQPRPGALNLNECVKMGVPPGPLLGKLKAGEDVVLPNGKTVSSKDVCEPDDPGPVFLVVDCPSVEYLDSLVGNPVMLNHQKQAKRDEDLAYLVVHFTPKNVMDHPRYKAWIDDFSPSTSHLVLNESNNCMGSLSVHRIQHKLNLLSEDLFPLLGDDGTEIVDTGTNVHQNKKLKSNDCERDAMEKLSVKSRPNTPSEPYIFANTFYNFHLRPKKGLDSSAELKIIPSDYIEETMSLENFPETLQELKQKWSTAKKELAQTVNVRPYPRILFLGTGSCIPNKTRNTSGILLETDVGNGMLLDCGEGTYGQIVRFYGKNKSDEILANINAIYVSHLHADHHIGLLGVLQGRRRALNNLNREKGPLLLLAPRQILAWLQFYDRYFENIRNEFQLIPNGDMIYTQKNTASFLHSKVLDELNMDDISTCLVRHCPNAFGISLTHKNGYKITYSGDTMPSDSLIELGKNSDLLIHEATMEDELAQEALVKLHSTTSQAIEVGKKMNAKHILLTHFSQRYAKLPRFNDNFAENVGIAFDNMHIKMDELPLVPVLYPALKLMFAEHYEELEHKAVKRQLRMEREREASLERKKTNVQNLGG